MLSVQIISTLPRDESNAQPFLNLWDPYILA
jgi:hypothetical protein